MKTVEKLVGRGEKINQPLIAKFLLNELTEQNIHCFYTCLQGPTMLLSRRRANLMTVGMHDMAESTQRICFLFAHLPSDRPWWRSKERSWVCVIVGAWRIVSACLTIRYYRPTSYNCTAEDRTHNFATYSYTWKVTSVTKWRQLLRFSPPFRACSVSSTFTYKRFIYLFSFQRLHF